MLTRGIEMVTCIPISEEKIEKLEEENQQLKEKIALRNKEKTDICNKIHNQKEKIKRHRIEITNLIAKNEQLKIQISAREEEYKKLENIISDFKFINNRVKQGMNTVNKEKMLIEIGNKILQELERGVSDVED